MLTPNRGSLIGENVTRVAGWVLSSALRLPGFHALRLFFWGGRTASSFCETLVLAEENPVF